MVLPLAFSPLSNPSYLPRLIFLKCCVHCTQKPLEAPWWPTGWSPDLLARQLSLPAAQFPLTFWPSYCNSLFSWYSCRGLLSPLLWTSLDCPFSCYGLWLSLCPSKCYSSGFQVPVQLIRSFISLAAFTVLIIYCLLLWLFVYTTCGLLSTPLCKFLNNTASMDRNGLLLVL